MRLVIAEKKSVATAIAQALCAAPVQRDGCYECGQLLVTWAQGHLIDLAMPEDYKDRDWGKWSLDTLPVDPSGHWRWKISEERGAGSRYRQIVRLIRRTDVDYLVNACDPDREGEAIFRRIADMEGSHKPELRLWVASLEAEAIQAAWRAMKPESEYQGLAWSAEIRSKADWLIGINGTRLFTTLYQGKTLNVGRVQTPTLALLAEREAAISGFRKEKFYTVELELDGFHAASERFASKTDAGRLRTGCVGKPATVQTVSQKEKTERPPRLYDLTTLQREANRLFDYTAQQTLDYLQALYEKRLATYPRTDSRYLTEDMASGLPSLCQSIAASLPFAADLSLPVNAAQVIDNSKVTDHHAILPTAETAKTDLSALPSGEKNILFLAAARLLCAVGEPHTYAETAVTLECGGAVFSAKGKTEIAAGWTALEQAFHATLKQKPKQAEPSPPLPALTEGQKLTAEGASVKEGATSPPAHFTEDTLLSAMEHASAEDFAKLEDVERKGLGTPATRAGVIEKLVRSGFVERKKKQLLPTEKGTELIKVMPDALKSAKLTAEWEERLGAVERGELSPEDFMAGISAMLTELIKGYQGVTVASAALSASGRTVIGICPRCGKNVVEGKKSFFCEGWNATPPCGFALWKNDRFFTGKRKELTRKVAAALLKNRRVAMTGLFSEKKGVLYDATVVMEDTGEKFVRFKLEFDPKTPKKKGN